MPVEESKRVATDKETEAGTTGPGRELRAAREVRGLSIEHVAKQLRLREEQIRALEADDYTSLPAPIYVCGYLRAYARLLGLQPEPLIAAYQQLGYAAPPPLSTIDTIDEREESGMSLDNAGSKRFYLRWIAYGVVLIALGMVYFTLANRNFTTQQLDETRESVNLNVNATELPDVEEEKPDISAANTAVNVIGTPVPDKPAVAGAEKDKTGAAQEPALVEEKPRSDEVQVNKTAATQAKSKIRLTASADSWVEVQDADGQRLFYDILKSGEVAQLEGVDPVEVLLGYAAGVKVEYNGAPYDQFRVSREGVAHFKLGESTGQ